MKKYVIKNADGSEQHVMEAVHISSEEAGKTLWDYLLNHNDAGALCRYDEDWVSPFDYYIIEEVECKDVSEVITDFESARKAIGLNPNDGLTVTQRMVGGGAISLKDVAQFIDEINPKHLDALIALNKLMTISEAWNKEDGFVPDFSDFNQDKWFPWFKYEKDAARFVCASTGHIPVTIGPQLCFKSEERAEQFGMQFVDLYNKILVPNNAE